MSHVRGEVIVDGKIVGYFEYDGTADLANPVIRKSPDELKENWRKWEWKDHDPECKQSQDVTLYADYGGGFRWAASACLKCGVITEGRNPDDAYIVMVGKPEMKE